jgi:hypothetical protein
MLKDVASSSFPSQVLIPLSLKNILSKRIEYFISHVLSPLYTLPMYLPSGIASKTVSININIIPKISVFIL